VSEVYGIVNAAIEDLVVSTHGESTWEAIRERVGLTMPTFVTTEDYPDELTYALVGAVAETLNAPPEEVLRLFGRHWITYTAKQGYGDLLKFVGHDIREFLANIDLIHAHVASSMPGLRTPTLELEDGEDGSYIIHYRSPRKGLAPMLFGLLEGIGEMFSVELEITQRDRLCDGADHDVFVVRLLSEVSS
jgi:hypothetical protein